MITTQWDDQSALARLARTLVSLIGLVVVWEAANHFFGPFRVVPPPSDFVGFAINERLQIGIGSQSVSVWESILQTVVRVFAGVGVSAAAAFVVSIPLSSFASVRYVSYPILQLFAPIAPIAWIPLGLILFGIGFGTALFIVFMGLFFVLALGMSDAFQQVRATYREVVIAQRLGTVSSWRRVFIPAAFPRLLYLIRVNFLLGWVAVIAAEMTGLRSGLGTLVMIGRNIFNYEIVMIGIVSIALVGLLTDIIMQFLQERLAWW
jgi:NitT/TauT family transport system permease protein